MNQHHLILHLSLIDGVGPSIIQKIIAHKPAKIAWHELYNFSVSDWMQLAIAPQIAQKIVSGLQQDNRLEKELMLIEKNQFNWMTILDANYPELLRLIHVPPAVLYWRGSLNENNKKNLAVVGARKADRYGQQVIDRIIPELVSYDYTIVSGGAAGADSMAHQATLDAGGKTIAVFGSGLLFPYPYTNKKLFAQIIECGGALVSAFSLQTEPYPGNFPARNRIIAGLSMGVIVVQAARKSGARITAQFALEQGRDVFAVPGDIDSALSDGCHALIQEGAKLVTSSHDILYEYGIDLHEPKAPNNAPAKKVEKRVRCSKADCYPDGSIQQRVISMCAQLRSIDDLAVHTKTSLSELQTVMFQLQMDGVIEQDFTGLWKVE